MQASDVMTRDVTTVPPDAAVPEIARILMRRNVSAVPVVDDGDAVVGIVSEGDLIRRQEIGTDKHPSWWLQLVHTPEEAARDFVKSHGARARDVMTRDVVSVSEDTELAEIAGLFERHGIKRVPVLRDGVLVGIVSRADLLRGVASHGATAKLPRSEDDAALRRRVEDAIHEDTGINETLVSVVVADGVVHLWGAAGSDVEREAARIAAEAVAGADNVVDHMGVLSSSARAAMWGI